jgi:hypothetical protein
MRSSRTPLPPPVWELCPSSACSFFMTLLARFSTSISLRTHGGGALVHAWVMSSRQRATDHWLRASPSSVGLDDVQEPTPLHA